MCGRIAIMNHGRLIALEKTADLLARLEKRQMVVHLERPLKELPAPLAAWQGCLEEEGLRLKLAFPENVGMGELLQLLTRLELPIRDMELPRPGLEDVFLKLTGLRDVAGKEKNA
jgi:ABC-2 type transport system ATP-binding protein